MTETVSLRLKKSSTRKFESFYFNPNWLAKWPHGRGGRYCCYHLVQWYSKRLTKVALGNPKSACLHFYTAKTQAALALPFLPCLTLRVEHCFDSGSLLCFIFVVDKHIWENQQHWLNSAQWRDQNTGAQAFELLSLNCQSEGLKS